MTDSPADPPIDPPAAAPSTAPDTAFIALPHNRLFLLVTLAGFALRLILLDRFPFREDEAIYAYWARHAWHEDPLFLTVWPDKPPIFIWLLSGAFQLFGASAASARFLNIALSTLTIPLVAATARKLCGVRSIAPLVAATTMALNPFAISFAPTAFTDPLLVFCGAMAFYFGIPLQHNSAKNHLVLGARPFWAGLWLAAAIMTKQQGLFYVPLVLGATFMGSMGGRKAQCLRLLCTKFLIGFALIVGPILYWDSLRWRVAPSPWDLSVRNYGALHLLPITEWIDSAQRWGDLLWYVTASGWAWLGLGVLALCGARRVRNITASRNIDHITWLLLLWCAGFVLVHIGTTIQPWDRYLLPLLPSFVLLVGLGVASVSRNARTNQIVTLLWMGLLILPGLRAAVGGYPIGGDHGAYAGLDEAVAWIEQQPDERIILYHRVLGWHYRFYFFEQIRSGKVELRWFPHAVYLADNATKSPHRRHVVVEPPWSPIRSLQQQATARRLNVEQPLQTGNFTVLEFVREQQGRCGWCLCRVPNGWLVHSQ